jgi:hypothetical protein
MRTGELFLSTLICNKDESLRPNSSVAVTMAEYMILSRIGSPMKVFDAPS